MESALLEEHIIGFLKAQNMCVLATCSGDIPRATPIEYRSKGLALYFVGEPGTKLKNIVENPKVSIGVFLPYKGWETAMGAQITGKAKIIQRDDNEEFKEALAAYNWEKTAGELGLKEFPKTAGLIRVDPEKIEFIDASLKKLGYNPRQTFEVKAAQNNTTT
jgi:nitroimidazol reductase NimA-like FMN-containing flavoprotein (pyridoxamine 5'-phosphate oxidase superfamily)